MAREEIIEQSPVLRVITIDANDAVQIISLLAAQLAGESLPYQARGTPPSINITEKGRVISRLVIVLERTIDNANPED